MKVEQIRDRLAELEQKVAPWREAGARMVAAQEVVTELGELARREIAEYAQLSAALQAHQREQDLIEEQARKAQREREHKAALKAALDRAELDWQKFGAVPPTPWVAVPPGTLIREVARIGLEAQLEDGRLVLLGDAFVCERTVYDSPGYEDESPTYRVSFVRRAYSRPGL